MKQPNNMNIVPTVNSIGQVNDLFNLFMLAIELDYANINLAHNTGMTVELFSPTFNLLPVVSCEKIIGQQETL